MADGELLDFGVSGRLLMNALILYDRQTESYWSQLLGEAVEGPLTGARLEPLPSVMTTWGQWRQEHPETLALETGRRSVRDGYEGYYDSDRTGVGTQANRDDRLPDKRLVVGVEQEGQARAYPHDVLAERVVLNDRLGGRELLLWHDADTATTMGFDRVLEGQTLRFELDPADPEGRTLRDLETGSRWSAWMGAAFEGELAGNQLDRVVTTNVFWFGWSDYHPETGVFEARGP